MGFKKLQGSAKWMFVFLTLLLVFVGCAPKAQGEVAQKGRPFVLSTTAMIDDLVGKIGGDLIEHASLVREEMDPHSYELVKGDDEKIKRAALVIGNGLNLEHGASLRFQFEKHPNPLFIGEEIQKRAPEKILYARGELDPHLWMDISLWTVGVDPIVEALSAMDPEKEVVFRQRGEKLKKEMLQTHREVLELLSQIPEERRYLVTSHDAFRYFARAYLGDAERCVAPEGLSPQGQLSFSDILRVIDQLVFHQIRVVFPESNVSRAALAKIVSSCSKKGHKVRISNQSLYGDAMGAKGSGAESYLEMMRHNARVLHEEWDK